MKIKRSPANGHTMEWLGYLTGIKRTAFFAAIFAAGMVIPAPARAQGITEQNIRFIEYDGFPEGSSAWNSIGYNHWDNTVYVGTTDHRDKVALYIYDASGDTMQLKGFISNLANLKEFQWQAKIHTKFVADKNGEMYFGTDAGVARQASRENPKGYSGGFVLKWDPKRNTLNNLGMGLQYESIKDMDIDTATGNIYVITSPQVHFLVYDPKTNGLKDLGRLGSAHVPRILFTDQWGNCYYVDWKQRLVKYEKSSGELVFAKNCLPAFEGTPGSSIITGITAFAKDDSKGVIYLTTYGAKMIAFYPQETGIGKVEDLGGVFDVSGKEKWSYYVPNLNIGSNGKLYYVIGGHGNYAIKDRSLFVEFDPAIKKPKVLFEYPSTVLVEATGCNTRDKEGNLYFSGKRNVPPSEKNMGNLGELGYDPTVPFLIKFNPDKKVQ